MLLAAAPGWFANNLTLIAAATLVVLAVVVVRFVQKAVVRLALIALIIGTGLFVFVNRVQLERCARTCECSVAGQRVDVPVCDAEADE